MSNYLKILSGIFIVSILWSAIEPLSEDNWLLEMLPVFVALPVLFYLGGRYRISDLSYTLIFIYLVMLVIQAHYGVGYVPIGVKLAPVFGTDRNVFDRFTHFFSGLLWFYPLYEMVLQSIGRRNFLVFLIPAAVILALGSVYEILEWLAFRYSGPRIAFLFIGAQDDFYDTPKDMAMALFGVILAVMVIKIRSSFFPVKIRKE